MKLSLKLQRPRIAGLNTHAGEVTSITQEHVLYYRSQEEYYPKTKKEFHVGEINPGEVFGIRSLIEPYTLHATAPTSHNSRIIAFDGVTLRAMLAEDGQLAYHIMTQIAKAVLERLGYARVQLAAAWA